MRISDWSSDVCSSDLIVGDMDLAHARDPGSLGGDAVHALPRHQQMNLAQLRRRGDRRQRGVLDGLAVVLDPDQSLHFATPPLTIPRAFSFATSSSTSATLTPRSEEHTSELQSLMRLSYAVFCLKKKHT